MFGRLICGWMCPFGFVQDMLNKVPFGHKRKNLPGHKYLKYLKYVILVVFVLILPQAVVNAAGVGKPWFCEYICPSGTLLGGIPLVIANSGLRSAAAWRFAWKVILLVIIVVLSMFFYRPFCKYLCPLGAIYSLFNPISFYRFKIDESACVKCGECQKACGMDIKVWETPNSLECIRCGKCKNACPQGAITSTFDRIGAKCMRNDDVATVGKMDAEGGICIENRIDVYGETCADRRNDVERASDVASITSPHTGIIVTAAVVTIAASFAGIYFVLYGCLLSSIPIDVMMGATSFFTYFVWGLPTVCNVFGIIIGIYFIMTCKKGSCGGARRQMRRTFGYMWLLMIVDLIIVMISKMGIYYVIYIIAFGILPSGIAYLFLRAATREKKSCNR